MGRTSGNYGVNALNRSQNSQLFNNYDPSNNTKGRVSSARVISIVLDETHPRFEELGGWNALGAIEYDSVDNPSYGKRRYAIAYPLNANNKHFPLIHEVITIITAFDTGVKRFERKKSIKAGQTRTYYISTINAWNTIHHNGYSFLINDNPVTQNKSYVETEAGSTSIASSQSVEINFGKTFKERPDIHPLRPFEGDITYEGRWGNSIRFGSTVKDYPNNWSDIGTDGDPIVIIRNGQGIQDTDSNVPVVENINNDDSSIYLASTQKVPLDVSSISYVSYNTNPPVVPSQYAGSQILLNSGRLVFNSKSDHILLSSAKSINLNSQESINIDTKKFITQADNIYLGKEDLANQQLMLGNNTVAFLKDLIFVLREYTKLFKTIQTEEVVDGKPAALPELRLKAISLDTTLQSLEKKLLTKESPLLSQRNYTL